MFSKNVGQTDRIVRTIVGVVALIAFLGTSGVWSWVMLIVGILMLATSALGTCPPYSLLGINTCQKS